MPNGDQGGNLFQINHPKSVKNLHRYWDRGGTLLKKSTKNPNEIKLLAKEILNQFPCNLSQVTLNPEQWAKESNALARKYAYALSNNGIVSPSYERMVSNISRQQIAKAGCRLAALLNNINNKSQKKEFD